MKTAILSLGLCVAAAPLVAGEVTIAKSHICCGGCVKAIQKTLADVEGISELAVNQDEQSVSFQSTDAKTARQAVRTLAKAGFGGQVKYDGKKVKLPTPKIEEGTKADTVTLNQIHLCCGQCEKAVQGAVSKVAGVESVTCDREKGSCTATGKDVSVLAVLNALRKAGFSGNLPKEKGKNAKKKADSAT